MFAVCWLVKKVAHAATASQYASAEIEVKAQESNMAMHVLFEFEILAYLWSGGRSASSIGPTYVAGNQPFLKKHILSIITSHTICGYLQVNITVTC